MSASDKLELAITLSDPGLPGATLTINPNADPMEALNELRTSHTTAYWRIEGKSYHAWRPGCVMPEMDNRWRPGCLTGEVREKCVQLGFEDPGPLYHDDVQDLFDADYTITQIAQHICGTHILTENGTALTVCILGLS